MSFEFAQPFDERQSEIDHAELLYIATVFSTYVDDIFLNHIDEMNSFRQCGNLPPKSYVRLNTGRELPRPQILIEISPEEKLYTKQISIQQLDETGRGGDTVRYQLGIDGIVRRKDVPKLSPEQINAVKLPDLNDNTDLKETLSVATMVLKAAKEAMANSELERSLGVNNQPIDLVELEALLEFVDSSVVR